MKLTKFNIEQLVDEITAFLDEHNLQSGVCIYFNNKRIVSEGFFDGKDLTYKWIQEENKDPHDYFDYAAYNHILSMSFEGPLYDVLNYYAPDKCDEKFREVFDKYGLYFELGNAWNLTTYPLDDDMEIEYTIYNKPEPVIHLYYHSKDMYPTELSTTMTAWYELSKYHGDSGSCVLGAGFEFEYNDQKYFMHSCSPYQGSLSWEAYKDVIHRMLAGMGATDIYYHWGNMD